MSSHKEAGRRPASPVQSSDREQEQDEDDSHDQQALLHKSEDPSRTRPPSRMLDVLITLTYCVIYLLVGPALILVNKKIMRDVGFGYPMMVSGIGQLSSAICSAIAIKVLKVQPLTCVAQVTWPFYLRNMMVVGGATAASLCFGNAGYLYLTVSFVQILKVVASPPTLTLTGPTSRPGPSPSPSPNPQAFTPVFVVAMLYITRVDVPSRRVTLSVVALCVGTGIASAGEAHFNLTGLIIMFFAETCEATRRVLRPTPTLPLPLPLPPTPYPYPYPYPYS